MRGHPFPADGAVKKVLHDKLGVVVGDAAGLVATWVFKYPGIGVKLLIAKPELGRSLLRPIQGKHNYNDLLGSLKTKVLWKSVKWKLPAHGSNS